MNEEISLVKAILATKVFSTKDIADAVGISRSSVSKLQKDPSQVEKLTVGVLSKLHTYFTSFDLDFSHPETIKRIVTVDYVQSTEEN